LNKQSLCGPTGNLVANNQTYDPIQTRYNVACQGSYISEEVQLTDRLLLETTVLE